ncbi:two-component hybrid sensor and regulator [Bradyrhizobiaceae bacterium SG-6C]|nr:two-component hybrid sensor and regulator [Bradyrhizobiaceae bacterium SG-6C]
MLRALRIRSRLRRFARRHPWISVTIRSVTIFSATFGGAYGFITGSRTEAYDPHAFALGASFLFAVACLALAMLSMRMRWLRKKMRKIELHNEALADRNWELKSAEEHARSLFESQGDLIVLRDGDGIVTSVNDAYCALARKPREALIGTRFSLPVLEQGIVAIEPNGTRIHDQKIDSPLGPRWIAWREGLIRGDAHQPADLQCVGRDVTDRTGTERALAEARDLANAANRAKSKFLAMASHEIRTPLNGIIGMSNLLLDTSLTAEQKTYAKAVKTSGDALMALIDELLDFSRIEAGKIDLEQRPFALAAMIEDITELLAPRAQARNLEIASYVDERLPRQVLGDAARLRQVLLNLAGNAIKFTQSGGVALIVEPGIWPGEISFIVRDTGIGIAPEAQQRIFREFEQASEGTARNYGGTGLGLSISDRIVRRMGGHIALESTEGHGATFAFSIPLAAADTNDAPAFIAPDLTGKSIMLMAPQSIEASLIARRLERWGAQTCTAADISIAHALLPERPWHAVLVDCGSADTPWRDFGNAAVRHSAHRIAMFTPAQRRDITPAMAASYTGYLVKPLRAASLAERLSVSSAAMLQELSGEDAPATDMAHSTMPPETASRALSILVAEDNEINALLIRSLLIKLGHAPVITTDGEQALESWIAADSAGTPYDVVLMDIQMPKLDGISATKRIRAHEAGRSPRRTTILALTANTLVDDRYACFEAGMDGFLIKPLDRDKLSEALTTVSTRNVTTRTSAQTALS